MQAHIRHASAPCQHTHMACGLDARASWQDIATYAHRRRTSAPAGQRNRACAQSRALPGPAARQPCNRKGGSCRA
eukprot:4502528-Alexandrium_andersonii.AAC.1